MVQIPPPDTGWTFFHIDLLSNFHCLFEKTENKWKRAENGPFKKIVGHLSTLPPLIAWLRWHTFIYSNLGLHIYISVGSFPINRSIDGCAQYNANPFIPRTWKDASRLTSRVILIHCSGYCLKVAHLLILAQSNAKYYLTHSWAFFVKVSKSILFLVKSFLGNFYIHLAIFFLVTLSVSKL